MHCPPFERKTIPILVDRQDQPIWAPLIRKAHHPLFLSDPPHLKNSFSSSWISCQIHLKKNKDVDFENFS